MPLPPPPGRPMRLLVVDDDEPVQLLLEAIFTRCGMSVELARDSTAALARLRSAEYDAVILDLMLPGSSGFEILRQMQSFDESLLARTVVLTAMSRRALPDFAESTPVRAVVHKPFELDQLVEVVLSCCPAAAAGSSEAQPMRLN